MALSKIIDTQFGVQASYHKITETNINWHDQVATIKLRSFVNQQARTDGKSPIIDHNFYWSGENYPFTPETNVLEVAYDKLKTLEQWSDATNV